MKTMEQFLAVYPTQSRTDEDVKILGGVWAAILSDVPDDALILARDEWLRSTERFMPTPGQLRERSIELCGHDPASQAERGWQDFIDCEYGRDKRFMTDGIMLRCVRELGGFDAIGKTEPDKMHFVKRDFLEKYSAYLRRENAFMTLPEGQRERVRMALGAGRLYQQHAPTRTACGEAEAGR